MNELHRMKSGEYVDRESNVDLDARVVLDGVGMWRREVVETTKRRE